MDEVGSFEITVRVLRDLLGRRPPKPALHEKVPSDKVKALVILLQRALPAPPGNPRAAFFWYQDKTGPLVC